MKPKKKLKSTYRKAKRKVLSKQAGLALKDPPKTWGAVSGY